MPADLLLLQPRLPRQLRKLNPEHYGPEGAILDQKGGALFGYTDLYGGYDGGQAEYVRVPYADYGPRMVPDSLTDEQVLFLTDIFPTGYTGIDWAMLEGRRDCGHLRCRACRHHGGEECLAARRGRVIIVDALPYRLEKAAATANCETILWEKDDSDKDVVEQIREMTQGRGADVCIDAVGFEPNANRMGPGEGSGQF